MSRELEARCEEAAEAVTGAYDAAPNGEGVMGAEHIAHLAALYVLRDGMMAADAVAKAVIDGRCYGGPARSEMVKPEEAATLAQLRAGTHVVVRRDLLDAMNAVCNGALESSIKRRKPRDMNARLDAWLVEEQAMLAAAQEPPRDE